MEDIDAEDMDAGWYKSSYSGNSGGSCVEYNITNPEVVAVRDSKDKTGPTLGFPPGAWTTFVRGIKDGELTL